MSETVYIPPNLRREVKEYQDMRGLERPSQATRELIRLGLAAAKKVEVGKP